MDFRNQYQGSTENPPKDRFSISVKKDEYLQEIQKSKRIGNLQKRRYNLLNADTIQTHNINKITSADYLKNLLIDIKSNDQNACYAGLVSLRVTSEQELSFLDNFNETDELISALLQLCECKDNFNIQSEAIKIISNISAGETALSQKLIDLNFIDFTLKAFDSFSPEIIDELLLVLGNIISESVFARDKLLSMGFPEVLVSYIEQYNSRGGIWAFCNLFRGHPAPNIEFCDKYFPFFTKKISSLETVQDIEISEDCLVTLVELTEEEAMTTYLIHNSSHLLCLLRVLETGNLSLITYVLRILANVLVHTTEACNKLMQEGLALKLLELLSIKNTQTKHEVCTVLSNLVSDNQPLLDIYIESGIISKLLYIIRAETKELMKEACLIMCKASRIATTDQIKKLYQLKVLENMCDVLTDRDPLVVVRALDTIHEFLNHGENLLNEDGENYFILELDSLGGIEKIEKLQDFPSELVTRKVVCILKKFFEVEEY